MDVPRPIPGYDYGSPKLPVSPVSLEELGALKLAAGFRDFDAAHLRRIGTIMEDHWPEYVDHLRQALALDPDAAKAARSLDGQPIPAYRDASGARLVQGFKDTCSRPFDQKWLDYQYEIALRHTAKKKNLTDKVSAFPYVPLRYVIAHTACIVSYLKPYLDAAEPDGVLVSDMLAAWLRANIVQVALFAREYDLPNEW